MGAVRARAMVTGCAARVARTYRTGSDWENRAKEREAHDGFGTVVGEAGVARGGEERQWSTATMVEEGACGRHRGGFPG